MRRVAFRGLLQMAPTALHSAQVEARAGAPAAGKGEGFSLTLGRGAGPAAAEKEEGKEEGVLGLGLPPSGFQGPAPSQLPRLLLGR